MLSNVRILLATIVVVLVTGTHARSWAPRLSPADIFKRNAIRSLLSRNEATKLQAVAMLSRKYAQDPLTAEILLEVLPKLPSAGARRESMILMIRLLRRFDKPEVVEMLASLLNPNSHPGYTMAVLDTLSDLKASAALSSITPLAQSSYFQNSHAYRKTVIDTVITIADIKAIEGVDFLIEILPRLKGQPRFEVVRYLCHISHQRFGKKWEMWQTWWADNRDDFRFRYSSNTLRIGGMDVPPDFNWGLVPRFHGIAIYAGRVVFLIDSGGHSTDRKKSQPTFDATRRELTAAIEALPQETSFSIIFVGSKLNLWRRAPSIATDDNKESAIQFVKGQKLQLRRDTYGGLEKAFSIDSDVEAIYFVGFGGPSTGVTRSMQDIQLAVFKTNRPRRVSIHTIAIDVENHNFERFLNDLARGTKGVFHPIRSEAVK